MDYFSQQQSQSGQRYNFTANGTRYDDDGHEIPSSDPPYNEPQTAIGSDDSTLLVDHLANNYGLNNEYRGELHTFRDVRLCFVYLYVLSLIFWHRAIVWEAAAHCPPTGCPYTAGDDASNPPAPPGSSGHVYGNSRLRYYHPQLALR
jgi:hypothetical protein